MSFAAPFAAIAERHPDKTALWIGGEAVSFGALLDRARRAAAGVEEGARVGLLLGNGVEFLALFLGTVLAGGVAVILDPKWSPPQRAAVLDSLPLDRLFDDADAAGAWIAAQGPAAALRPVPPDRPFLIGFTSGTTSRPKAFTRDQGSWAATLEAGWAEFGVSAQDRILVPGPLVHGLGLYGAVEGLAAGASVHLLRRFDAAEAVDALARHRLTAVVAVPTMLVALLRAADGARLPDVRRIVSAGAKLSPQLRAELAGLFPQAIVYEYYGASELSFVSVAASTEACPPESVGRAFRGVEIDLRRDDGAPAAPDEPGTVWVRSAMLSRGYVGPADGAGFRMENGWATVGDRGWVDGRGFLHLIGREGDMLISGGLNAYPAEVEAALKAHPAVEEAHVFGRPDPYWGQEICAVLRGRGDAPPSLADLRAWCRGRLDAHKCPRHFYAVRELPLTTSGKLAGATLRAWIEAGDPRVEEIR
ncbi:AMP-binding protein [Azospirillum sp.]|uniref:AMP-binding protein n=1 Tax=Azospirillum sp. TaxID=34012 RepID=UPI003D7422DC